MTTLIQPSLQKNIKKKTVEIAQTVANTTRGNYTTPNNFYQKKKKLGWSFYCYPFVVDVELYGREGVLNDSFLTVGEGGKKRTHYLAKRHAAQ